MYRLTKQALLRKAWCMLTKQALLRKAWCMLTKLALLRKAFKEVQDEQLHDYRNGVNE